MAKSSTDEPGKSDNQPVRKDRHLINCADKAERDSLIEAIHISFPYYTRAEIGIAVDICCRTMQPQSNRHLFIQYVKRTLELRA
jgi:hypothetical protein